MCKGTVFIWIMQGMRTYFAKKEVGNHCQPLECIINYNNILKEMAHLCALIVIEKREDVANFEENLHYWSCALYVPTPYGFGHPLLLPKALQI